MQEQERVEGESPDEPMAFPMPTLWAFLMSIVVGSVLIDMNNDFGPEGLVATVPGALLAWWGFLAPSPRRGRWLVCIVVVASTVLLAKNLIDAGVFGVMPWEGWFR